MTYKCPVCEWTPDSDVDDPENSVIAHMSSSIGEHRGIGYQKARTMLNVNENGTDTAENDDTPTESENPVMGNAEPAADTEPDTSTNSGVELPCGHESYDPSEAPDPPFKTSCDQCGGSWRVSE